MGFYFGVQCVRYLAAHPLYCSAANAGVGGGERLWWWFHPLCMTQQYLFASMAVRLSSTGSSHHSLLTHIPSIPLSTVNSITHLGIAPQSLNYSPQPLYHLGYVCMGKDCLILIPFRLLQISCFSLGLKWFSSDRQSWCGDGTPAAVPPLTEGRSTPINTPSFPPSSFILPSFLWVYIYILFCWSGTPVCSQLAFCKHFCVWRCIPDVSMKRDVFHVHLLLHHLAPPKDYL